MPSLQDMPKVAMEHIAKRCDLESIVSLRKVSHNLRDFLVDLKPDIHLTDFQVVVSENTIYVRLDWKNGWRNIEYQDVTGGGCYVVSMLRSKFLKDSNFLNVAAEDIKFILAHQKATLNTFELDNLEKDDKMFNDLIEMLTENRTSADKLLRVKNFIFATKSAVNIHPIMTIFAPEILQKIRISNGWNSEDNTEEPMLELTEVIESEVWKKAKSVCIFGFCVKVSIREFLHFDEFIVTIPTISCNEAHALKEMTRESESFKTCSVFFNSFPEKRQFFDELSPGGNLSIYEIISFKDHDELFKKFYNRGMISRYHFDSECCFYQRTHN